MKVRFHFGSKKSDILEFPDYTSDDELEEAGMFWFYDNFSCEIIEEEDSWQREIFEEDLFNQRKNTDNNSYRFDVKSISAMYIKDKYKLKYNNVFIEICLGGVGGRVGSFTNDNTQSDLCELNKDDLYDVYRQVHVCIDMAENVFIGEEEYSQIVEEYLRNEKGSYI